jgi:poly-gamma-glutamate synthesis protein (capsule biosynthesis protein)
VISIAAVGDLCLGDHYFNVGHGMGSLLESARLDVLCAEVTDAFAGSDIVFGNLESPLRQRTQRPDDIADAVFVGRTRVAGELAELGFNALNIANNHILQHGEEAFHETITSLSESGIHPVGLVDGGESYCKPVLFEVGGEVVALLGYSDVDEVYGRQPTPYARFDRDKVASDIRKARRQAHRVAVSLHFGTEGIALPTADAIRKARWLIENDTDLVLGHHPHVFQPVEKYRDGLIVYSMGNFIFDLFWRRDYIESAIAKVVLAEHGIEAALLPVRLNRRRALQKLDAVAAEVFNRRLQSLLDTMNSTAAADYDRLIEKLVKRSDRFDVVAKSLHFFGNIGAGNSALKMAFIRGKMLKKVGMAR